MTLAQAITGALAGWRGLPVGFDEAALRREIDAEWAEETRERVAMNYRVLAGARATEPEQVEAWIRFGEAVVNSVEFRPPLAVTAGTGHGAVLADLGEPELVLASNLAEAGAMLSEHVHASRGITVTVAEPFEHTGGDPYLAYAQLYAPTDTQGYVVRVGQPGYRLEPFSPG
jgi:hypothetical protein